ncbi:putative leucine-rich repeat-containing protein DDB_G0290503 [Procambarus clarkii]|uniref:putative leucine-rich repeat-containing protein DDB_G0290503 n=1 Tax=Procambarus clarkii TaxID=6728 RepID=UPI0037429091
MEKIFLETAIAEKERKIIDLNKQLDKFTTEIEKQKNIINKIEIENNEYEEELKTQVLYLGQLKECEDKIEKKDKQIKELDNRNIQKHKQLTEKDKQIPELGNQIEQLNILTNSNNTEIKSKNVELNKKLQLCTTQLSEQTQKINRINEELTQSYRHIAELNLKRQNEKHQLEETYKNELEKCNYEKHELEKTYMKQLEEQKQAHHRQYEEELLSLQTKELEKHQQEKETYKQLQGQMLNKYNKLLDNINTTNIFNNTLFNNFLEKSILSNDEITKCFSNIMFINNNYSSETNKLIKEIIIKIIDHFNTEHNNYIRQEHTNRIAKLNEIINSSNYNDDLQQENIANILFTNEEERGLFNHILNSSKTNITDEIGKNTKKN